MQFDDLDQRMRVFETAHDLCVLPGIWMVARLDGRNFTRLTRELHSFVAPFDEHFRDLMLATAEHLMTCGFRVIYGWTSSDEISLLLHPAEDGFGRKERKLISILAGDLYLREPLRVEVERRRILEEGVANGQRCGRGADARAEREHRDDGDDGVASEVPPGGAEILVQFVQPQPPPGFVEPLGDGSDVAEFAPRRESGLVGAHALGDQAVGFVGDVCPDLFG